MFDLKTVIRKDAAVTVEIGPDEYLEDMTSYRFYCTKEFAEHALAFIRQYAKDVYHPYAPAEADYDEASGWMTRQDWFMRVNTVELADALPHIVVSAFNQPSGDDAFDGTVKHLPSSDQWITALAALKEIARFQPLIAKAA